MSGPATQRVASRSAGMRHAEMNRFMGEQFDHFASGRRLGPSGIVIGRMAGRQMHERRAYLQKPRPSAA